MKFLFFRATPRGNIEEVEKHNPELMKICDMLQVKYTPEYEAYGIARDDYFLKNDYDYLILATDDIVVEPYHLRLLIRDIKDSDLPVFSGMMNVDQEEYMDQWGNLNICPSLPSKNRRERNYEWYKRNTLPQEDWFSVGFAGFGLTAIRRDVVEQFTFDTDSVYKNNGPAAGASLDLVFCYNCKENDIPIYIDQRIDMKHLRTSGTSQVGIREKEVLLNNIKI